MDDPGLKSPSELSPPGSANRLDSWKEIAAYLKCSERTVRRWEKEGLPVHRHVHEKKASVYAFKSEIDAWWRNGGARLEEQALEESQAVSPRRWPWRVVALGAALVALTAIIIIGLRNWGGGTLATPPVRSLAVLPLENLSGDPGQEYFADGMTDELITNLAQISGLRVISRTSVMHYKGTKKPLAQIARELDVDAVVEGTVVRFGPRVRITAQLVHAPTDRHLWAGSYERDLRDVLVVQNEVAQAISDEVKVTLTPQEQKRLASARPVNPEAYELYLKGRYFMARYSADGIQRAIQYFNQAIEKDPNNALALAGLSVAYGAGHLATGWVGGGLVPPKEAAARARAAAEKALQVDETLGEAHAALATIKFDKDWDFAGAEREYQRAVALSPSSDQAHHGYSHYLAAMGRFDESLAESKLYLAVDPLSPAPNLHLGWHYLIARQYDQAIEQDRKAMEMDPNYAELHGQLALAYVAKNRYEEAIAEMQKAVALSQGGAGYVAALAYVQACAGRKAAAQKLLGQLLERSKRTYVPAYSIALIWTALGEKEKAFNWLQRAYAERSKQLVYLKVDSSLDPLRSDPRFQDIMRRVGIP